MAQDFVGTKRWIRPATPYEIYMEEQNLPIHRGVVGFYDIRELALGSWQRMGAKGAFIELNGCGGLQGVYVIEVPGAGAITPEKHMYEEIFYVLEGRGTTEIWSGDDANKKQTFEWQPGSLFSPPLNTWHRIVNATSSPALLFGVTNAPPIFHLYRSQDALFNNPYQFNDRYDGSADYFKRLPSSEKIRATDARATTGISSRTRTAWSCRSMASAASGTECSFGACRGIVIRDSLRNMRPAITPAVMPTKPARCCCV
jgi:Cupin domain